MTTIHQSEQSFLLATGHVAGYLKRRSKKKNENSYLVLLQLAKYVYYLYGVIFRPSLVDNDEQFVQDDFTLYLKRGIYFSNGFLQSTEHTCTSKQPYF